MNDIKERHPLSKFTHTVRMGQSLTPFGVGAMVDFIDQTLMAASPEYWQDYQVIHDERLERTLNVEEFRMPPDKESYNGLPFVRFPEWYFCPKCKKFKPIKQWQKEYRPGKKAKSDFMRVPICMECRLQLVPAGIITVCENGHINDFPWIDWVHVKSKKTVCGNPQIKIKTGSSALGLEGLQIECTNCGAKANMKGAFSKDVFEKLGESFKCKGHKPWSGEKEKCILYPTTVQRGGSNVYFPKIVSSIVIPPYSEEINVLVEQSSQYKSLQDTLKNEIIVQAMGRDAIINSFIKPIADQIHKSENAIRIIVNRKLNYKNDDEKIETRQQYREEEYNALTGNIPMSSMSSKDFKIEIQDINKYGIDGLKGVTLVKKLREVRALIGFSRLNPPEQNALSYDEQDEGISKCVKIKGDETKWYPAYEARGEGIFLEVDNEKLKEWECNKSIRERIQYLDNRFNAKQKKMGHAKRIITPRFVMLHTLSHLLIKELSFECGYSSASLAERIYCNEPDSEKIMSGILIYTASGDSEGTLGGLVKQGKPDFLPRIIQNAVRKAKWCSADPVCIESLSQGRNGLNLSACHACTLISETSCEEFNVLLDRATIVGTLSDSNIGFFEKLL